MDKKNKWAGRDLDELSELSGEGRVKQYRYVLPVLKFNGNTGKFKLLVPDAQGNFPPKGAGNAKEDIEFVIIAVRRGWMSYKKTPKGSIRTFSAEHDSSSQKIAILERDSEAQSARFIDEIPGDTTTVKKLFPELRFKQVLYILFEGKVVKFSISGGNLSPLFEYYREFKGTEHLFQFVTKLGMHEEEGQQGTIYRLEFFKGKESDPEKIEDAIREVRENLELQDKSYRDRRGMEETPEEGGEKPDISGADIDEKDIPVIQEKPVTEEQPAQEKEEIKEVDIPL